MIDAWRYVLSLIWDRIAVLGRYQSHLLALYGVIWNYLVFVSLYI